MSTPSSAIRSRNLSGDMDESTTRAPSPSSSPRLRNSHATVSFSSPAGPWSTMLSPRTIPPPRRLSRTGVPVGRRTVTRPPAPPR